MNGKSMNIVKTIKSKAHLALMAGWFFAAWFIFLFVTSVAFKAQI